MTSLEHFPAGLADGDRLLLSEPVAARYLGISPRTLFTLRKAGKVPFIEISPRCLRYSREALAKWVADQSASAKIEGGNA